MKKSFFELYLEKKNSNSNEVHISEDKEIPKIRSPNRFYLRVCYFIKQLLKLIILIVIFILSVIGAFSITNDYIRNEIIWLLFY